MFLLILTNFLIKTGLRDLEPVPFLKLGVF